MVLNSNQIQEIIPHRPPFLLIDKVIELEPGFSATAIKNVTANDDFFKGHFPQEHIMPGVLI
ncbi:MAG TPA: 3-hydroxyacyl-[acyl-carrier-protein] dehydratase FabZ, partial [Bacillota bacterium]|nr:3-hydroxyacyl-[acyl-carrier-protein] dehydratase FabZ [Bacillota bacterium]